MKYLLGVLIFDFKNERENEKEETHLCVGDLFCMYFYDSMHLEDRIREKAIK
jgi:hypothetical protein